MDKTKSLPRTRPMCQPVLNKWMLVNPKEAMKNLAIRKIAQATKPVIPLPIAVPALTSKGDPSSLAS